MGQQAAGRGGQAQGYLEMELVILASTWGVWAQGEQTRPPGYRQLYPGQVWYPGRTRGCSRGG